jgi:branched-chain amino acid aminotransferase
VFDTTRTFGHRVFKLREHVERLYRSLRYLRIDPGLAPEAMVGVTEEVLRRNLPLIGPDEDYWVSQRVSRGLDGAGLEIWGRKGATVIVECVPLPLRERASLFRDGIRVVIPSVRRTPPEAFSPRVKTHNYLNLIAGDLEVRDRDPDAWAVLLETPREQGVLAGISRDTVIDLARESGLSVVERDIDLYDAYTADEAFLTSTSLCICPVRSVNGAVIGHGTVPGPLTRRLTEAYGRFVDFDFVGQYLKRLA